jgi:TRAP-type C4-dicarboxylate transport system permease small subunit
MKSYVNRMNGFLKVILNAMLFLMVLLIFLQVVFRFVFDNPLGWTEESARFLLVWITFLGAAYAMASGAHIGIDAVVRLFPEGVKKVITVVAWLASVSFFILLVWQGFELANRSMGQTSPALDIPMGYIYFVIPVSGLILIINMTAKLFENLKGER